MDRAARVTAAAVLALWVIHFGVSAENGLALPDDARSALGASPASTLARPWAHFSAPFLHYGLGHLAYNSLILAAAMPVAIRAFGAGRALVASYLTSPAVGILVNLAVVLPLGGAGVPRAVAAADVRLVGASVVAFAAVGLALSTLRSRGALAAAVAALLAYEATLAAAGVTQHFVGLYHSGGFVVGVATGLAFARAGAARAASRAGHAAGGTMGARVRR